MTRIKGSAEVAQELRRMILKGELEAGVSLVQEDLARRLGVSRTPLREALVSLAAEGLVSLNPNRSATVFRPSASEVVHSYEIREALEALGIDKAVRNFPESEIGALTSLVDEMENPRDLAHFMQCNRAFHETIYRFCGNPRLERLIDNLGLQLQPYTARTLAVPEERRLAQRHHRELIRCLRSRDVATAREVTIRHLHTTTTTILQQLGVMQPIPTAGEVVAPLGATTNPVPSG